MLCCMTINTYAQLTCQADLHVHGDYTPIKSQAFRTYTQKDNRGKEIEMLL